jgi:integrase
MQVLLRRRLGTPRRQHKESHPTLPLALEAQGKRRGGDTRPTERITFGSYYRGWIKSYAGRTARGFQETTRTEYKRSLEAEVLTDWEAIPLGQLDPQDVRDLFGKMAREGKTKSQIVKGKRLCRRSSPRRSKDGKASTNIVLGIRIPVIVTDAEPEEEKAKALTRAELKLLLGEIDRREQEAIARREKAAARKGSPSSTQAEDWLLFFEFLLQTGVRIGEAIGLRWEHLDLGGERGTVRVREQVYEGVRKRLKTSNGKRDLPLSPGMTGRLLAKRARLRHYDPKAPVFASAAGTELRPANVYRRVLAPAAIAVGLSEEAINKDDEVYVKSAISFHTFRHTCASFLFARGRNIKQVQKWLGHADPAFTLRTYLHLIDEGVGDADFFDFALVVDEDQGEALALAA